MGTEGPSKWRVSSSASSRVCRELSQNQPLGSSAVQGRRHRLQKGLAKGQAEGKRAYVAEETQFDLGVKRVSNKIIECLEDAGGDMSLKELREGRINSRDKRKGRNIFVAAIEFLTKNKRTSEKSVRSLPEPRSCRQLQQLPASTSTTCLCGRDDALDDLWSWRILWSRLG